MTDEPTPEDNDLECQGSSDLDAFAEELGYSIEIDEDQKATIRARSAELRADPSICLSWAQVKERLTEANAIRRAPGFAEEAHKQSAAVAGSPDDAEDQAWVEAIQAWPEEDQSTGQEPTPSGSQQMPEGEAELAREFNEGAGKLPTPDEARRLREGAVGRKTHRIDLVEPELVRRLNAALGPTLVSLLAGATDQNVALRWADPREGEPPSEQSRVRLLGADHAWTLLTADHSDDIARNWFIAANPRLGDDAPVERLRSGDVQSVVYAARAFAEDTFQ